MDLNALLIITAALSAAVLAILIRSIRLMPPSGHERGDTALREERDAGAVVRVRSAAPPTGRQFSVPRPDDESDLPPTGIALTMVKEPGLYREYMSPSTSAVRRMEIADMVYDMGMTLPYQKGLYEQYLKETGGTTGTEAASRQDEGRVTSPVDLSAGMLWEEDTDS